MEDVFKDTLFGCSAMEFDGCCFSCDCIVERRVRLKALALLGALGLGFSLKSNSILQGWRLFSTLFSFSCSVVVFAFDLVDAGVHPFFKPCRNELLVVLFVEADDLKYGDFIGVRLLLS